MIKFLARDSETGRIGTISRPSRSPISIANSAAAGESVVLSSQKVPLDDAIFTVQQKNPVTAANPLIHDNQKLIPSVTRVFSRARDLFVYVQAYEREATATRPLIAFATFYQGDTKVFESTPAVATDGMDARSKAVPIGSPYNSRTCPGRYECQITILDPGAQKRTTGARIAIVQ